ncbi:MAG: type II toxin-antitoxin system VapC family toxin [Geodermatophilaceae bacterium]|nr:type II toxin-antitoxin system VapC family toxin [Geodermatophilaceae bacterium]MDQ3454779.1 type II toxin-antitoxin system VapC family toxin [Actinomycetota bacterium]
MRLYLDSSAIVKLIQAEAESPALRRYLRRHRDDQRVSSLLARTEVVRAVRPRGSRAVPVARQQLARLFLLPLDRQLLDRAGEVEVRGLRSLDAIHVISAQTLGAELRALVTYDVRMQAAADELGLPTVAPA